MVMPHCPYCHEVIYPKTVDDQLHLRECRERYLSDEPWWRRIAHRIIHPLPYQGGPRRRAAAREAKRVLADHPTSDEEADGE